MVGGTSGGEISPSAAAAGVIGSGRPNLFDGPCVSGGVESTTGDAELEGLGETTGESIPWTWRSSFSHSICDDIAGDIETSNDVSGGVEISGEISDDISCETSGDTSSGSGGDGGKGDVKGAAASVKGKEDTPAVAAVIAGAFSKSRMASTLLLCFA